MLEIFHIPRTRSQRIIWLAEEMGLPYEIRRETFGQPSAELLAANPSGKVPAIRDGEVAMGEFDGDYALPHAEAWPDTLGAAARARAVCGLPGANLSDDKAAIR